MPRELLIICICWETISRSPIFFPQCRFTKSICQSVGRWWLQLFSRDTSLLSTSGQSKDDFYCTLLWKAVQDWQLYSAQLVMIGPEVLTKDLSLENNRNQHLQTDWQIYLIIVNLRECESWCKIFVSFPPSIRGAVHRASSHSLKGAFAISFFNQDF